MIKKILFTLTTLSLVLAACAPAAATEAPALAPSRGAVPGMEESAGEGARSFDTANTGYSAGTSPTVERMVIKDVQISLAVDEPEASAGRIQAMAEEMGGYVVSLNMYQTTLDNGAKVPQGSITVRVPAERLTEALGKIKAESSQPVLNENINSQDITAEYTDLSSDLRNLEAAEAQLQEIMDGATKTEDVLLVYNQLVSTRGEIERIKGQMQYYEQAVALSSVAVELYTNEAVQPLSIGTWEPKGVAKDAIQDLINTLEWLANAAIRIVLFVLPVAICIFGPLVLIVWGALRIYNKRKRAKTVLPPKE
ncbi:MAG: hypothetical protein A2W36_06010 [Chloroflexi bacterium RBG_16_58_14]|nr:MAG: hypothetical protein A2W36_06010 [Chloroflexi bacterium RBG_16_58_14]